MLANCLVIHAAVTLVKSSEILKKPSPAAKIKVNRYGRGSGSRGLGKVKHMALESSLETI